MLGAAEDELPTTRKKAESGVAFGLWTDLS